MRMINLRCSSPCAAVIGVFCLLILSGFLSPITLNRAGIAYDDAITESHSKQLLINIARAQHHEPIHFTGVSNIAATFDFRFTAGATPGSRWFGEYADPARHQRKRRRESDHQYRTAFGSGTLATVVQDLLSILIFFAMASWLIRRRRRQPEPSTTPCRSSSCAWIGIYCCVTRHCPTRLQARPSEIAYVFLLQLTRVV